MEKSTMKKGAILTLLGATCWGLSGVLGEYLLNISKIDSTWVISNRLFYSGIVLVIILFLKDKKSLMNVFSDKKDILRLLNFSFFISVAGKAKTSPTCKFIVGFIILVKSL